jgi:MacB-like periplasmic core domain
VLETIRRDLRLALRQVGARPAFALVVVLTLALGIGSTTAVFSLVNSILLRPLPFLEPDRLVRIQTRNTETGNLGGNVEANLLDWRRESAGIESIAYNYWMRSQLTRESGPAIPVRSAWVNADFFSTLRIAPILGRTFVPDEDRAGGDIHKLVLSYDVWHTLYGGEVDVLGRRTRLDNTEYEVIGVLPRGFRFPGNAEVWGTLQSRQAKEPEWEPREVRTRGGALQRGMHLSEVTRATAVHDDRRMPRRAVHRSVDEADDSKALAEIDDAPAFPGRDDSFVPRARHPLAKAARVRRPSFFNRGKGGSVVARAVVDDLRRRHPCMHHDQQSREEDSRHGIAVRKRPDRPHR